MDFFEAVDKRYSHKGKFLADAVPLADLERIADAGLKAPTGMNSQCVRLIILSGREAVSALHDAAPVEALASAPAAIAVLTDGSAQGSKVNFEVEDYAAATANMLLAAVALGYVSLWLDSPYFGGERHGSALSALGVPAGYQLRVVLPIGKPDGEGGRREKLSFGERVHYGRFGG